MISCPKCAKENQDHYKFCLGCGAELPRSGAPKVFSPATPPHGIRAVQPPAATPAAIAHTPPVAAPAAAPRPAAPRPEPAPVAAPAPAALPAPAPIAAPAPPASVPAPAPEPAAAGDSFTCPQCSHQNLPTNRFCASCGYNLSLARASAPAPAAPAPAAAAATVAMTAAAPAPALNPVKLTALRPDGSDLGSYTLPTGVTTIGRDVGGIFAGDSYLSPKHATFDTRGEKILVKDESSLNGVYRKIPALTPVELTDGAIFRIGQEIVRFEALKPQPPGPDGVERLGSPSENYIGRIALLIGRETTGNAFPVPKQGIHIGRERGDVLFPEDGYVSGLHCRITYEEGRIWLTDVGSSNGTFLRIRGEEEVQPGEILLMGQQLYRVER